MHKSVTRASQARNRTALQCEKVKRPPAAKATFIQLILLFVFYILLLVLEYCF